MAHSIFTRLARFCPRASLSSSWPCGPSTTPVRLAKRCSRHRPRCVIVWVSPLWSWVFTVPGTDPTDHANGRLVPSPPARFVAERRRGSQHFRAVRNLAVDGSPKPTTALLQARSQVGQYLENRVDRSLQARVGAWAGAGTSGAWQGWAYSENGSISQLCAVVESVPHIAVITMNSSLAVRAPICMSPQQCAE